MPAPSPRVLVVEDDPDIRLLFTSTLRAHGYDVATAEHGAAALELLAIGPAPALIVADLHMPVMDGWHFLAALADNPALASIPVIVLTAADDPSRAAPRPPTVLYKPVSTDVLLAAVSASIAP